MANRTQSVGDDVKGSALLTADMLARLLMLNVSRIHQMGREGIIPRESDGKYKLVPAVQGYIKFLKKDNEDEDLISLSREKAKLTKAQREKAEHELAVIRHEWIAAGEVEMEMAEMGKIIVDVLSTLPDTCERDADLAPYQVTVIESTVNNLRQEIYNRLNVEHIVPRGTSDEPESDLESIEE